MRNLVGFVKEKTSQPFKIVLLLEKKIDEYFNKDNSNEMSLQKDVERVIKNIIDEDKETWYLQQNYIKMICKKVEDRLPN